LKPPSKLFYNRLDKRLKMMSHAGNLIRNCFVLPLARIFVQHAIGVFDAPFLL